jgi:hypothetical protein
MCYPTASREADPAARRAATGAPALPGNMRTREKCPQVLMEIRPDPFAAGCCGHTPVPLRRTSAVGAHCGMTGARHPFRAYSEPTGLDALVVPPANPGDAAAVCITGAWVTRDHPAPVGLHPRSYPSARSVPPSADAVPVQGQSRQPAYRWQERSRTIPSAGFRVARGAWR